MYFEKVSLVNKLMTAVRASTRESMQVVVDANSIRILAQEIYESEQSLGKAKYDLTQVVAEKIRLQREIENCQQVIHDMEQKTAQALELEQQGLALECAEWIAENETVLNDMQQKQQRIQQYETKLTKSLKKAVSGLNQYRRALRMAKATASSQSASARIYQGSTSIGENFANMEQSLDRIKLIQQNFNDQIEAREDVDEALMGVSNKLAGTSPVTSASAEDVLRRIRGSTPQ